MGCPRLDILDAQYYNRAELWEGIIARSEHSIGAASTCRGEASLAPTKSFGVSVGAWHAMPLQSFVATKENEEDKTHTARITTETRSASSTKVNLRRRDIAWCGMLAGL